MKKLLIKPFMFLTFLHASLQAPLYASPEMWKERVSEQVRTTLETYCADACKLLQVKVDTQDPPPVTEDIGFESVTQPNMQFDPIVSKVRVEVQVDERVDDANRDRLSTLLKNQVAGLEVPIDFTFKSVVLPEIMKEKNKNFEKEELLKKQVKERVKRMVEDLITLYAPDQALISKIGVQGKIIPPLEALSLSDQEVYRENNLALKIASVTVDVQIDSSIKPEERTQILGLMKAHIEGFVPASIKLIPTPFPETHAQKMKKLDPSEKDPYGLEKLRQMLTIFKDLAGTKEIITKEKIESDVKNQTSLATNDSVKSEKSEWMWPLLGLLAFFIIFASFFALKMKNMKQDAELLSKLTDQHEKKDQPEQNAQNKEEESRKDLSQRMKVKNLREDLMRIFVDAPKVARDTFSRLMHEEGVEKTAPYVAIFGHVIIYDLLDDPSLQRYLKDLSEFYHRSQFDLSIEDEWKLLTQLKTRVTASEIRVLTSRNADHFEFLQKLDAPQIYNLVIDEKPQVQGIVLTQLDPRMRRSVFEMFSGQPKINLLKELGRAEAIPKEFLANVGKVLHKKVTTRPEFDAENMRSGDILLELLEKASVEEQRVLLRSLEDTNKEASRILKLKLVSSEILAYLKDGHLLDIVLGLERADLLSFLSGCPENIRRLLLAKAPEELAESWLEELGNLGFVNDQAFRAAEAKIISRIRQLAVNGYINLLDINNMIFSKDPKKGQNPSKELTNPKAVVA